VATADLPALPTIKVARFKEIGVLLERLVDANTDLLIDAGQRFRERHRAGTTRPLSSIEVAQIAAGLDVSLADAKAQIDDADLTAYDEADPMHLLLAAGVGTAPAWFDALLAVVALIELPDDAFRAARESGPQALRAAIAEGVVPLEDLDLKDARARAQHAMDHLAAQSGVDSGKAWEVLGASVWQALTRAAEHLRTTPSTSSLIASPASTTGSEQ
jgi:hypothetical protein